MFVLIYMVVIIWIAYMFCVGLLNKFKDYKCINHIADKSVCYESNRPCCLTCPYNDSNYDSFEIE